MDRHRIRIPDRQFSDILTAHVTSISALNCETATFEATVENPAIAADAVVIRTQL